LKIPTVQLKPNLQPIKFTTIIDCEGKMEKEIEGGIKKTILYPYSAIEIQFTAYKICDPKLEFSETQGIFPSQAAKKPARTGIYLYPI
jgi:hypothetical protein